MSYTPLHEPPEQVLDRIIRHAKQHLELAIQALQNREWDTLEFTLRVVFDDMGIALQYINKLREHGMIKSIGVSYGK